MLQCKLKVNWIGLGWSLGGVKFRAAHAANVLHLLNPLVWVFVPLVRPAALLMLEEAVSGKPAEVEVEVVEVEEVNEVDAAKSVSIRQL